MISNHLFGKFCVSWLQNKNKITKELAISSLQVFNFNQGEKMRQLNERDREKERKK